LPRRVLEGLQRHQGPLRSSPAPVPARASRCAGCGLGRRPWHHRRPAHGTT